MRSNLPKSLAILPTDGKPRRQPVITGMLTAQAAGNDCSRCVGTCCTDVANSMQIDLLEAAELVSYLTEQQRVTKELADQLDGLIAATRLDHEVAAGPGRTFRRRYTCPFYGGHVLGCSIAPRAKPYGCLAFNPRVPGQTNGGECVSDQDALAERQVRHGAAEEDRRQRLRDDLKIYWDKQPIPVAVRDVLRATGLWPGDGK